MLERIRNLLTPEQRKSLYLALGTIGVFLVAMGWLTPDTIKQVESAVTIITGLLLTVGNLLAALNVPQSLEPADPEGTD